MENTAYAPLPIRKRDLLEIFDTGLKLYRRYFWVLFGWSVVTNILNSVLSCVVVLLLPLLLGACSCCIAAAVRGQNVTFSQCWRFTKPRYWSATGQLVLGSIIYTIGTFSIFMLMGLSLALFAWIGELLSVPSFLSGIGALVFWLLWLVVWTVLSSGLTAWMLIAPMVACLEDDKRNGAAQNRAWDLLKREWWRATGLYTLIGLALAAVFGMALGVAYIVMGVDGVSRALDGTGGVSLAAFAVGFSAGVSLLLIFMMPLILLVTGVFYLDLRVRKEALDLEWTAHVSAPEGKTAVEAPNPAAVAPQPASPQIQPAPETPAPGAPSAPASPAVEPEPNFPPGWEFSQPAVTEPAAPSPAPPPAPEPETPSETSAFGWTAPVEVPTPASQPAQPEPAAEAPGRVETSSFGWTPPAANPDSEDYSPSSFAGPPRAD